MGYYEVRMALFHRPGWAQPNGHIVRSHMEASLCDYLTAAREPHEHGAAERLSFNVTIAPKRHALYVPSIILTRARNDGRVILIEPIDSVRPGGGLRRLQGFRQGHRTEYCLIVVARRALHPQIPEDAYELLVPLEDFTPLDEYLLKL
jgi:hypothetical protein